MSVSEQILRIQTARNTIRSKLVSLGLAASSADIDDCATAVDGITNQGAVSVEILEGKTYTIPAGYHNGAGIVKALTDREGDITERYKTQAKSVTPTKSQQPITPDEGYYALESVMVEAIPETYQDVTPVTATASDVLANKIIVDSTGKSIAGTMRNNGAISGSVARTKTSYTIPAGHHDGTGTVSAVTTSKTVTPTKSTQTVTGNTVSIKKEDGTTLQDKSLLTSVTVNPIPDAYQDVTGVTAVAANVLAGKDFVTADGTLTEGTMVNRGASYKDDMVAGSSYTIPAGYHNGQGKITTASLASQTSATADAADILSGETAWVNGTKVTGTMRNRGTYNIVFNPLEGSSADSSSGGYYAEVNASCDTSILEEALAAI